MDLPEYLPFVAIGFFGALFVGPGLAVDYKLARSTRRKAEQIKQERGYEAYIYNIYLDY